MKDDEIELLFRSFDDDLDARDRQRLSDLLEGSSAARSERIRLLRLRDMVAARAADGYAPGFADRVMDRIYQKGTDPAVGERPPRPAPARNTNQVNDDRGSEPVRRSTVRAARAHRMWRMVAPAAAIATVLLVVAVYLVMEPRTINVPHGEMETLTLRDGSSVELGGGSTMTYDRWWRSDERRVRLEGEAFFDVQPHEKPFVVETFNAQVTVVGTQFNVRAWRDDPAPETAVALASGRVTVAALGGEAGANKAAERLPSRSTSPLTESVEGEAYQTVLQSGQGTSVAADSTASRPPRDVALEHILTWRSGGVAFVDQPLGSVFNTIERRFGVDVRVTDDGIEDRLLTYLNPDPGSAANVLSDICHTLDLHYRRTANGYEVLAE